MKDSIHSPTSLRHPRGTLTPGTGAASRLTRLQPRSCDESRIAIRQLRRTGTSSGTLGVLLGMGVTRAGMMSLSNTGHEGHRRTQPSAASTTSSNRSVAPRRLLETERGPSPREKENRWCSGGLSGTSCVSSWRNAAAEATGGRVRQAGSTHTTYALIASPPRMIKPFAFDLLLRHGMLRGVRGVSSFRRPFGKNACALRSRIERQRSPEAAILP